mmetsp:Transcript_2713/g.4628  ORF Transcript_2713/g.4628 Transcript_2713/m.4628 type:complete len:171 (-) Transcript_2713:52-564(-)
MDRRRPWFALLLLASIYGLDFTFPSPGKSTQDPKLLRHTRPELTARWDLPVQNLQGQSSLELGALLRKACQAVCGLFIGVAITIAQVSAIDEQPAAQAKSASADVTKASGEQDEVLRKNLKVLEELNRNPESFWDGEAAGPEPEGASYGMSRGMMKSMRAAMKKRAASEK